METGVGVLETLTPQHLLRSTPLPWSPPFREFRPAPLHLETLKISLVPLPTCDLSRSCLRGLYPSKPPSPFTPEASVWFSASTLGPLWCIFSARVRVILLNMIQTPGPTPASRPPSSIACSEKQTPACRLGLWGSFPLLAPSVVSPRPSVPPRPLCLASACQAHFYP